MEIPVYLITGFLESGKTLFIQDTIEKEDFPIEEKKLLILCEEGEEEYDKTILEKENTAIVVIEEEKEFTFDFLKKCHERYHPERVIIEYNGMWRVSDLFEMSLPKEWVIVQMITLVNAATFDVYVNNMRSMFMEEFTNADMVIFNRCVESTNRASYRRSVKAVNGRAEVYFDSVDGSSNDFEEEMPFDINADLIELEDEDFGIWYIDAMDEPKKYIGKKIQLKGLVYKPKKFNKGYFVPGRFAMTCCADDVAFIGFVCKSNKENEVFVEQLINREWVKIIATIRYEFQKEYRRKGPVLYLEKIEKTEKPNQELVYFT